MNGKLNMVSVGPGTADLIAPLARQALEESDVIVGYELYLRWIEPWIKGKEIHSPPLTQERARAQLALDLARSGRTVALISSGDIGVYAMATLAFEDMREDDAFEVRVVPGITSANACASLLGAPLSHDFATLSLSDLLCPWEWIETRARHIAQADLAAVFYNVQSKGRPEGVYRILRIMLEHKRADTLCGIVRNAYRPGQSVDICTLEELPGRRFDMLTSLVIGNRYTQRRRGWIFTPRGYGDWDQSRVTGTGAVSENADEPIAAVADELPLNAAWVFSGTSDGNALAREIAGRGTPVVLSAATTYGGEVAKRVAQQSFSGIHVLAGRRGIEMRRQDLRRSEAKVIVDATHPYAEEMSRQLMALAQELALPYLRFERPGNLTAQSAQGTEVCDSMDTAARLAIKRSKRIFLATGSKDLATFLNTEGASECEWFVRITPEPDFLRQALSLGMPASHICSMQGPFSSAFNEALWRDWGIDCVVTKDSGEAGGYGAKSAAAAALGIPLLVVRRPQINYPLIAADVAGVLELMAGI
ncbi:MAG: precorrin-3B C(17)-methyltransferase [Betaproteobacteria bacterium HGW-Betaproteobacteria-11]|nr:MAG: precorrin-3B C(17)-methyltransferase [Betaproteobacteria bacterium HGW-Betaproteobacteria-11]